MLNITARPSTSRNTPFTPIAPAFKTAIPQSSSLESYGRIDKYKVIKQFKSNHLNPVFLVQCDAQKRQHESSNKLYVVKTLELNDNSFTNETKVFNLPPHENIISCKEILNSVAIELDFDIRIRNAIVLEHAVNGDLFPYISCGPLPASVCRFYFGQLLEAVDHLHANGYCHLDIKPENLLFDERFNLKLCDFGFSAAYTNRNGSKIIRSSCGTSSYFPPEAFKPGQAYDGTKADIYQCGLLLFIMLTAQPPFTRSQVQDGWFAMVARGRWDEFWDLKEKGLSQIMGSEGPFFSPELRDLFRSLLNPDANERPTINEIKKSKWFTEIFPAEPIEIQYEMLNRQSMRGMSQ